MLTIPKQKMNKLWRKHKNKHYIQAQQLHSAQEIIQEKVMEICIVVTQCMLRFIR